MDGAMLSKSLIWFSAKNHCKMILKKEPLEEIAKSTTETGEKQDKPEASCKITADVTTAMKLKVSCSLQEKLWPT